MNQEIIKKIFYLLVRPLNFHPVNHASILMYHSVSDNGVLFTVCPADFKRQLSYLRRHNYNVISLAQLLALLSAGKRVPAKSVVLTFDDGYLDNYTEAWPVLKQFGIPATIFLPTAYLGQEMDNSQKQPLKIMTADQIKELAASGLIDFGSHTHTHPRLDKINDDEFAAELAESKKIIKQLTNRDPIALAYPKGVFRKSFFQLLGVYGFKAALTVREGLVQVGDNFYMLNRNFIYSAGGFSQFKGKLGLAVVFYNKIKNLLRKITSQL